jgi:tetratricopeptide (TPR) repeat protein
MTETVSECFNRAVALSNAGDKDKAIATYRLCIKETDPKYAKAWYGLGLLLDDNKDIAGTEEAYNKALEINPKYPAVWNNLGVLLENNKKDIAGAEDAYNKAVELNPKYTKAWNNLGNLLMDHKKDYAGATVAFKKVLAIDPEYADAKYSVDYIFEVLLYDGGIP